MPPIVKTAPIKKTFSNSTNTFAPNNLKMPPKFFNFPLYNFTLNATNIYKIAPKKYEVETILAICLMQVFSMSSRNPHEGQGRLH